MNVYAKYFDKNRKYINHWVKYEKILKKYLKIWNKIKSLAKKELNSEPVYKDKYIKSKIKIYNGRVHTNFQHNKIPKDNENCACSSVILFLLIQTKNFHDPQIFLEKCKYAIKVKK